MKKTVVVDAPGKINLALDITGKREDGYHIIDTVMQSIDLFDRVTLSLMSGKGIYISCDHPMIPNDEDNLAYTAARCFLDTFHIQHQKALSIDLQKRLPVQAGLAGGSTDAAAVIVGLDVLFDVHADRQKLCEIGAQVGADVPFCIMGGTRRAGGVGEELKELPPIPPCQIVVAKPVESVSTAVGYRRYDALESPPHADVKKLVDALCGGELKEIGASLENVFEQTVSFESVAKIKAQLLKGGAYGALMTGSGSAVFGIFENRVPAKKCMHKLYGLAQSVFLVRPVYHGTRVVKTA